MPGDLEEAIAAFIDHYNYRRYHEGLGDVTPYDVYTGIHLKIIQRGKEAKSRTLQARRDYRITIELLFPRPDSHIFIFSFSPP
jgi:hypothetical protein